MCRRRRDARCQARRRRVAHPLATAHEDGLAGAHVERAALVLDAQRAVEDERPLVELRALAGLDPALG
jgi:hypothetical protein